MARIVSRNPTDIHSHFSFFDRFKQLFLLGKGIIDSNRHVAYFSKQMAWTATPSVFPRLSNLSLVLAFTLTFSTSIPKQAAIWRRMAGIYSANLGACKMMVASTFSTARPLA